MIRPKYLLLCLDLWCAYLCLVAAYVLRLGLQSDYQELWTTGILKAALLLAVIAFSSYFFELYDSQKFFAKKFLLYREGANLLTLFFLLSALFYLFPSLQLGRGVMFLTLLMFVAVQLGIRGLIRRFSSSAQFASRIFIIGAGQLAQRIYDIVPKDHNIHSYIRFVSCTEQKPFVDSSLVVGDIKSIDDLIRDYRPQKIITALAERRGNLPLREFMHSKLKGIDVIEATTYFEQEKGCLLVEHMQPSAFVYTHRFRMTPFMRSYKRIYDVVFSTIGLILTAPLFPLLSVLIKLDSPGPVFFRQLRVGEGEVEFFVYKFRTMAQDAEKKTGAVWAQKNDPRVTRLGKFMRKTRLDEIPQLYNVLKGDMSFIGPRPERMAFVERLKETIPFYSTRHFVKPGVTGWAQVCYPYGASDEDALEKLRYDLFYIKNYSILLDFRIIVDTIRVVTSGFGGR
ncbi:TIGR03013 family XrtA/PEP-CTERM system glycosyltransferase [Pelobacter seleniigenes]|uniref:TIGR03013 family XrtA/PEP-CTERM system glycosyltransferase n=1 Tax=Pelobacter seleniigenes TaxID=407188 RepID=UPI0004A6FF1D|nr:TIGR03013 family XrtA/PEP-CTERM system glycosyltransferase [Pelobacter seleniigenes]